MEIYRVIVGVQPQTTVLKFRLMKTDSASAAARPSGPNELTAAPQTQQASYPLRVK